MRSPSHSPHAATRQSVYVLPGEDAVVVMTADPDRGVHLDFPVVESVIERYVRRAVQDPEQEHGQEHGQEPPSETPRVATRSDPSGRFRSDPRRPVSWPSGTRCGEPASAGPPHPDRVGKPAHVEW